jgi:hypothetical protein
VEDLVWYTKTMTFILLGGRIYSAKDGGKAFCDEILQRVTSRPVRVLDCLFARPESEWVERFGEDGKFFEQHSSEFEITLAKSGMFVEQVENADVVFFQGGIPKVLIGALEKEDGWREALQDKIVVGSSGGADVLCQYYGVGKTGRVGEGLGLIPVKFIPHWKNDESFDWDTLLENLKNYGEDLETVVLREGEFKVFNEK